MKRLQFLLLFCLTNNLVFAQNKAEFLPQGHLFEPLLLDPLEAQASASVLKRWEEGREVKGLFAPFTIGFRKPLVRWTRDADHASELSLDLGAFTQFEIFEEAGKLRRLIYNTDYKISLFWSLKRNNHAWRFRFYHLSSHLGDDYVIRTGIVSYFPNAVNYEQFDALYSTQLNQVRLYGGGGFVLSAAAKRERAYLQAGTLWKSSGLDTRFVAGADLRLLAQTDYTPNLKAAIGVEVGKTENRPIDLLIEFYTGKMPYSVYEQRRITWTGLGLYFNPF
ncbi:MAG: DUF1207 domain-containing protein [Cytophagaceae bacterium]|nr:DUF1207 domain-containing protein [Cytophagaceae bacterium]